MRIHSHQHQSQMQVSVIWPPTNVTDWLTDWLCLQELSDSMIRAMRGGVKACLLANHGMVCYGSSVSSALKLVRFFVWSFVYSWTVCDTNTSNAQMPNAQCSLLNANCQCQCQLQLPMPMPMPMPMLMPNANANANANANPNANLCL